jgi:hypothetical protein
MLIFIPEGATKQPTPKRKKMNNLKTALTTSLNNDERYELKNSYYGITDNLPGAIEALTLAYENACRDKAPSTTRAALAV